MELVYLSPTSLKKDIKISKIIRPQRESEFNSDDHYIYYCGKESLRRNGVAIIVNKRVHLFGVLVLKGLFGLRVIIQLQLLQCYRLGHRLGLLWY